MDEFLELTEEQEQRLVSMKRAYQDNIHDKILRRSVVLLIITIVASYCISVSI